MRVSSVRPDVSDLMVWYLGVSMGLMLTLEGDAGGAEDLPVGASCGHRRPRHSSRCYCARKRE